MKNILFFLICNIVAITSFSQTEEERRAIIAAKNKIQSDSLSLHSRSMRVQEAKRQNDQLTQALENAYKTIGLHEELSEVLRVDLEVCSDSLAATQTQLEVAETSRAKEEKSKKNYRKAFFTALGIAIVETAILILL